ncbi:MAG TPA: Co2+/Mg2+ efflux protein ApaG [Gammaproteobacteria bacterium]|mgnify:CR=1 FL=1|nr:Co2+/Mg2+ efflux protein ApaG [Gammaproteobacteria bacterium]
MSDRRYGIRVSSRAAWLDAQSEPERNRYAFSYTITIENHGTATAQLLRRHWIITDAHGKVQEVRGEGVVGEQPVLAPGTSYRYTSGAVIDTPVGTMQGSYSMIADDGHGFDAEIPTFRLAVPNVLN